jgi:hypothetical protein
VSKPGFRIKALHPMRSIVTQSSTMITGVISISVKPLDHSYDCVISFSTHHIIIVVDNNNDYIRNLHLLLRSTGRTSRNDLFNSYEPIDKTTKFVTSIP